MVTLIELGDDVTTYCGFRKL